MSSITLVLPPDKQYYVSYFIISDSTNSGLTNKYKSNITTAFENTWVENTDLYNFWLENKKPGSKVNGTTYTIPDDPYYSYTRPLNYAIISWKKEDNTYEYVVWAFLASRFRDKDSNTSIKKDNEGNILVYINFIKNGVLHLYAPGKKLNDYELGINDLIELEYSETILCTNNKHIFPMDVRIDGYVINEISNGIIGEADEGDQAENTPKITPMYNVIDGSIPESKAIELVGGIIKPYFGNKYYPIKDTYTPTNSTSYHALYSIRCKFTKLNEKKILSNGETFPYRLLKLQITRSVFGYISEHLELYIDKNNNKLIMTGEQIEINLPANFNIYDWHEWAFWHESDNDIISHIYLDGNLLWNGSMFDQSNIGNGKIGWDCGIPFVYGSVSQSMAIDQIRVEVKSDSKPYEMTLTDTFNYYLIPTPEYYEKIRDKKIRERIKLDIDRYYAMRLEAHLFHYGIDVDKITKIVYVPFIDPREIIKFAKETRNKQCGFFCEIGKDNLRFEEEMGNLEWVVKALKLDPRIEYTADSLTEYLEEFDNDPKYPVKDGVYLIVDEDKTIFDSLIEIFKPSNKHVGLFIMLELKPGDHI